MGLDDGGEVDRGQRGVVDEQDGDGGLGRALALLGSLEARIMELVWAGSVSGPFTVHEVHDQMPELAYTTVLTTMRRLADKGLLHVEAAVGRRSHHYHPAVEPAAFLAARSEREAEAVLERYGDAALAAFASRLDALSPAQRAALRRLRDS